MSADFTPNYSDILAGNAEYAANFHEPELGVEPTRRVVVIACMDSRMDIFALLGWLAAHLAGGDAVGMHGGDQQGAGDGSAQRGGVEVGLAGSGDVERTALQRHQTLVHQLGAAVDDAGRLGAVLLGAIGHAGQVALVLLAQVGGVAVGHGALFAHPRDGG